MELSGMDSISINEAGISLAFVPEDRIGMGLVGDMDMTDNMMIRSYRNGKGLSWIVRDLEHLQRRSKISWKL